MQVTLFDRVYRLLKSGLLAALALALFANAHREADDVHHDVSLAASVSECFVVSTIANRIEISGVAIKRATFNSFGLPRTERTSTIAIAQECERKHA